MGSLNLWRQPSLMDSFFYDFDGPVQKFTVPVDIKETEDQYLFRFDIPGVNKEDIDIELHGNRLSVSGERKTESEDERQGYYRTERSFGKFQRSFQLPEGFDGDKVEADYKDGILELKVGKQPELKPRKIKLLS